MSLPHHQCLTPPITPTGEPAAPEHVGLAIRAVGTGILAGLSTISAVMWLVRTLQVTGRVPAAPGPSDSIANLILFGWIGSGFLSALTAWGLMSPIASAYRRGAFAMVAGLAMLLVAMITAPVDQLLGRWGLLGLAAAAGLLFLFLLRRVNRLAL